ncbi:Ppx/GppA family phosphatase [Halovulum dunhuangense]|uniref:Ppx/GppA family phosphatase n=1 Tax=Halovulum dunhuangense TaxID=1505036 RepID=A0A849L314_9RHOB|nr:Ppx/GppA phosphatase family protein [Halovulum dunhuangense]NNU80581.1 Ppx/GppA family phosphatase [Halovulum dunhuangense]
MAQKTDVSAQDRKKRARHRGPRSAPAQESGELYAALDLGTNSCRMLIAAPQGPQFTIVDAFAKSVRLGADLERTGALSRASIERTIRALQVCAGKLRKLEVRHTRLVATEACRRAKNGRAFIEQVEKRTGLHLELIRPEEEARLAVISCAPLVEAESEHVMVFDIGGGSTELVWIDVSGVAADQRAEAVMRLDIRGWRRAGGPQDPTPGEARIVDFISVPLGVATLHERFDDVEDESARFALMSWYFEEQLTKFRPYTDLDVLDGVERFQMIGTSGTVTTVAAAHLGLRRYDRRKVDGLTLSVAQIETVIGRLMTLGPEGRRMDPSIGKDRAELIVSGAAILQTLIRIWPTDRLGVADRGLREGMLLSMMNREGALRLGNRHG